MVCGHGIRPAEMRLTGTQPRTSQNSFLPSRRDLETRHNAGKPFPSKKRRKSFEDSP
jgi:hypothetical protein